MKKAPFLSLLLISLCLLRLAQAQSADSPAYKEAGHPYVQNFSAKQYNAHQQNWSVLQDNRGVLYFGNLPGVLEYDGVYWRLISTPNKSVVRSLDMDSSGTIYVGAHAEFGYLAPDSMGWMQYYSLLDHVQPGDRTFNNVWKVHATPGGIYFRTSSHLFLWSDHRMQVWKPGDEFHRSFWVRDAFYIREWGVGLLKMAGDSLGLVPGGGRFAEVRVDLMLPFGEEDILLGTRTNGLFLFDGSSFKPFATEADLFLQENHLYDGVLLPDGTLALATLRGGVAIIDRRGRFLRHLDANTGLQDNTVWSVATDRQGGLWLALNKGLARVETPSPFSYFSEALGIEGSVESIQRHRGRLYAATGLGVYFLAPSPTAGTPPAFKAVPGIATQAWSLLSTETALLVATTDGIYRIAEDRASRLTDLLSFFLYRSTRDPNRVYVGLGDGLGLVHFEGGRWRFVGRFPGITEEVRSIVEDEAGNLWLGTQFHGALHVTMPSAASTPDMEEPGLQVERYGQASDLPAGEVIVYLVDQRIVFGTTKGLWRFDPHSRSFVPDATLGAAFADTLHAIHRIKEDAQGRVWVELGRDNRIDIGALSRREDGGYDLVDTPLGRLADFGPIWAIYPDPGEGNVVWFGGDEGIVRYEADVSRVYEVAYSALVRQVKVNGDSLIFGGTPVDGRREQGASSFPELDHANYTLRFEYAAPSYDDPSANQFQYFLEGFDKGWSAWTGEAVKEYTNLPEGDYRFRVRAKNIYQHVSGEDVFTFTILPPWYRAWWAYVLYAIPLFLGIFAVDRFQRRRLIKKEREKAEVEQARLRAAAAELQARTLQAEAELLQSELKFLSLAESANDAIISADSHGDIIFWNKRAEAIFGYTKQEALGKALTLLMPERYREAHEQGLKRFLSTGEPRAIGTILELHGLRKDGGEFPVSLSLSTWQTEEGIFFSGILRDITERRLAEEKLRTAHIQLAHSEKMASLGKLTAGIAHEIKNPLNFVNNFATLSAELADELADQIKARRGKKVDEVEQELADILRDIKQNAEFINRHGQRADGIVRSMMAHARGGTGRRQATDVNALIDEYVGLAYHGMRSQRQGFQVTIERDFDERVGTLDIVPQEMGQVLLNLLSNAFDAVHEKTLSLDGLHRPTVTVSTRRKGDAVKICVRDNGPGIHQGLREKIFEPFFTTKPAGQGTGLGLSLSYDIVAHGHGGMLSVESEEGRGTTFIITLPDQSP